jgi:transposase InsO family protein
MPWQEYSIMSLRHDFVVLASHEGANVAELCRRFSISRKTGYKWLGRYREGGPAVLADRSRRPDSSPRRSSAVTEEAVLGVRDEHPAWGGRKIARRLQNLGLQPAPAPSTVTAILRRNGRIDADDSATRRAPQRFEAAYPNDLWQMDFKGHFPLSRGRCHPLTVLDDHSRFAIGIVACADEQQQTVQRHLAAMFRCYGLPQRMLMDNGSPWGASDLDSETSFGVWLMRLGVQVCHGHPYHPQTQGKEERFNQTLLVEVIGRQTFTDIPACQRRFDAWRDVYNYERPHEAIGMEVPANRYQMSQRAFPESLPPIVYGTSDIVRIVQGKGEISFQNRPFKIGKAFRGQPVALRPTTTDGIYHVFFCQSQVASIDLQAYTEP